MAKTEYIIEKLMNGENINIEFSEVSDNMLSFVHDAEALGLSITKLASKCGMDIKTMSNLMNGISTPKKDHLLAICIVLEYDIRKVQETLKCFGHALHAGHVKRDMLIANAIINSSSYKDGEAVLNHIDNDILIPKGHEPITNMMKHMK